MSEKNKNAFPKITQEEIFSIYMAETNSKRIKNQSIERTTALSHYERVKELIKPVIDFTFEHQTSCTRDNVLRYAVEVLKLADSKYITLYLKREEKIAEFFANQIVLHGTDFHNFDRQALDLQPLEIVDEDELEKLYDNLMAAADNLSGVVKNSVINQINQYFQNTGHLVFIKPYFKCKHEYLHFLNSITNTERYRILIRMEKSYRLWLMSIKKEYGLIE